MGFDDRPPYGFGPPGPFGPMANSGPPPWEGRYHCVFVVFIINSRKLAVWSLIIEMF